LNFDCLPAIWFLFVVRILFFCISSPFINLGSVL
jgi:hypothetical protein